MSSKSNGASAGAPAPPVDYLDLSCVTPLLTAHTLDEKPYSPFQMGGPLRLASAAAQRSGHLVRRLIFEKFFKTLAVSEDTALQYPGAMVANWFASLYPKRPYHHIILGPPLGAMAYLSSVLDAPFLPLNYRMAVAHPGPMNPDNILEHSRRARDLGEKITKRDPFVEVVCEYDPAHERLRIRNATLMRYKFLQLPRAYEQFIRTRLAPGGTVILVESRTGWNQYNLGEHVSLQVGLTGGISDEEFLRGSKRMADFREQYMGDAKAAWRLKMRTEVQPESCFGVSPQLRASVISSCAAIQKPVCHLFTNDIFQVNNLVSSLYLRCARREGKRPQKFYVHSGLFIAPHECMQSLLLPLWVPNASLTSFTFAKDFLSTYPYETDTTCLALEPCVSGAPDSLPFKQWVALAGDRGRKVHVVANKPRLFPFDITAYFDFMASMQAYSRRLADPLEIRVNLDMLLEEAQNCHIYFNMHQHG